MKKIYIEPVCFKMPVEGCIILANSDSEPEVTSNIGAKESGDSFENPDEEGNIWSGFTGGGSLWGDAADEENN